ncbi:MAG: phosphatase PAP2 family protein [Oscillospiraceae bacterium]|jgi:undecaprenyl-diphosphatase|nr:phosphatase PAP2 family protein [Oscillospiraceae bacterium]MCI1991250.1 phosphatase PAP2 family protein [Oscillospiraceae bacterium]MCI2036132.1 phosphatase PAP2 family protein [Oscillospiraceae bacterium]
MDVTILNYVQDHFHNKITDFVFTLLSRIGNAGAVWIAFAIFLGTSRPTRRYALMLFFSIALAHLISQILKPVIGRPRPFVAYPGRQLLIHTPGGYSCPSGHSASSFAAATVICMADRSFGLIALLLACSIAFSRIFLFVHYPSDTVAGSLLGVFCAILIFYLYKM